MNCILIVGTGLIGASIGLALRQAGFEGKIVGWDKRAEEAELALARGALSVVTDDPETAAGEADVILLATPVLAIMHWMERLSPILGPRQLVTDVGSTKYSIDHLAQRLYNGPGQARFLPGHPMAGKENGGAAQASGDLFQQATWIFTREFEAMTVETVETDWSQWVRRFGANPLQLQSEDHDRLCAWISHLPQLLSTALAALLQDEFGSAPELDAIGGRALREMTRLGASPHSMWRDVVLTNAEPVTATLLAFEQRLAHLRENLRGPELREEFTRANAFRLSR